MRIFLIFVRLIEKILYFCKLKDTHSELHASKAIKVRPAGSKVISSLYTLKD